MEINILYKQGMSIRKIARQLHISRNTARKYLKCKEITPYQRSVLKPLKLDAYLERVGQAHPVKIPATVIFRELEEKGYKGSLSTLRNFLYGHYRSLQKEDKGVEKRKSRRH